MWFTDYKIKKKPEKLHELFYYIIFLCGLDKEFDVEIQRKDAGAGAKRARHNSSLLDAHILKPGDDTENIPDSYVIFITENDVMKGNRYIQ